MKQPLFLPSVALFADLYELTMAYGYWKNDMSELESVFNLSFRASPFNGGFTICCGLDLVVEYLQQFSFTQEDIEYLGTLKGNDNQAIFEPGFLNYLSNLKLKLSVDAIAEGTVIFPHEPIIRVKGPLIQAQIIETALINFVNFQSLIATKAARIAIAAKGDPILEMGMRRAHGADGALSASRAAFIGGCTATSNLMAGKVYGIPVKGTQAHSWVMSFDDELSAFKAYAKAKPNDSLFLVDTYDSLQGVKHAVEVGKWLKDNGHKMIGIRLDSGDLAYLSQEAKKILDSNGFEDAIIVATNDLDETVIESLKLQGSAINVWGIGTKLVTAYDQPSLGCVYKLSAIQHKNSEWKYKIKLSEQSVKVSIPGILQTRRFRDQSGFIADVIYDERLGLPDKKILMVDPLDPTRRRYIESGMFHDLLKPIFQNGKLVARRPTLLESKNLASREILLFHSGIKRFLNPHRYPVGLESRLNDLKVQLTMKQRSLGLD